VGAACLFLLGIYSLLCEIGKHRVSTMGRRRRQKVRRRPQKKIPDVYPCPNCGNTAIKIELYRDNGLATVKCGSCGLETNVDSINSLTEPVDVYGDFIDTFYQGRQTEAY